MRNGFWLLIAAFQMGAAAAACDTAQAQLIINEVMASPARDWNADGTISSRDDEWVELYNSGAGTITLDGYRIADADTTWRMELTGTLPPHGHRIVYGAESLAWEKATKHPAFVAILPAHTALPERPLFATGLPKRGAADHGTPDQEEPP